MSSSPISGTMVYWRFKQPNPTVWRFGYVTYAGVGLIRMGYWNGDSTRGPLVDPREIEWRVHE